MTVCRHIVELSFDSVFSSLKPSHSYTESCRNIPKRSSRPSHDNMVHHNHQTMFHGNLVRKHGNYDLHTCGRTIGGNTSLHWSVFWSRSAPFSFVLELPLTFGQHHGLATTRRRRGRSVHFILQFAAKANHQHHNLHLHHSTARVLAQRRSTHRQP